MSFARANIIKPNALFNFSITEFGKRSAICEEGDQTSMNTEKEFQLEKQEN